MAIHLVDYAEVMASRSRYATWSGARSRLRPEAWPEIQPSFQIATGSKIFTIGSCFARNIEEHLQRMGCEIPTLAFEAPPGETAGRRNSILNKYTPTAILQEIEWTSAIYRRDGVPDEEDCAKFCYKISAELVIDNNLDGFVPVTRTRFLERRRQIYDVFKNAFSSECVVITAGMVESWYNSDRNLYIQQVPTGRMPEITRNLKFVVLDFDTCFRSLDETITVIRDLNPDAKFLLTTSPVPLARTFTRDDVILANSYSKSTLRSVCGELVSKWDGLDYFSSYESAQLTRSWEVFQDDLVHVTDSFVARIVSRMTAAYISDVADAELQYRLSLEDAESSEAAVGHARRAVELSPDNSDYNLRLGVLLMAAGQLDDAASVIRRGHALQPTRYAARQLLIELANAYATRGDLLAARDLLIEAIARASDVLEFRQRLVWLHRRVGDLAAAEAEARRCVTLFPTKAVPYSVRAVMLSQMDQTDEAIAVLLRGLHEIPDCLPLVLKLAGIYHRVGDEENAVAQYRRALKIEPADEVARRGLRRIRQARGKMAQQNG